jgi:hypothetical protein
MLSLVTFFYAANSFALRLGILTVAPSMCSRANNVVLDIGMLILSYAGKIEIRYVNMEAGNHIYFMTKYW